MDKLNTVKQPLFGIQLNKKLLFGTLFLFVTYLLFWRICETTSLIYIDDVMYANWTQHGFKYFFEQIQWHYNEFNGRTFVHVCLSLVLIFKEHLYSILTPLFVIASTFMIYDMIKPKSDVSEKMIASGIVNLVFISLSGYYFSSSVLWMSGGFNYIFPLFFVLLGYNIFNIYLSNNKYLPLVIVLSFLAGATTEQYGMYYIGLIVLTIVFNALNKNYKSVKKCFVPLVVTILGYASVVLAPGTQNRVHEIGGLDSFVFSFGANNQILCGSGLFVVIIFLIAIIFSFMLYSISKKMFAISILLAFTYAVMCKLGLYSIAGVVLMLHFIIIGFVLWKNKINDEIVKLMICGYGTFFMMNISTTYGARLYVPFLLTYIIIAACSLISKSTSKTNSKLYILMSLVFVFANSLGILGCFMGAVFTEREFNIPVYNEISNTDDNVITINFDRLMVDDKYIGYRHSTLFDSSYAPDFKQYYDYYGYDQNVLYNNISDTYDLSGITLNGTSFVSPIINKDGKSYVPYTSLFCIPNTRRVHFADLGDIKDYENEMCAGIMIDEKNFYALSSIGLLSMKNGSLVYLNKEADLFDVSMKNIKLTYIELSQFCEWADATYTYDTDTDTYHFVTK